jgi:Tfp pilus assembly protein PilN
MALLGLRPAGERLDLTRAVRAETAGRAATPARRLPVLIGAGAVVLVVVLLLLFGPGAGDRDLAAAASRAQADVRQLSTKRQQVESQVRMLTGAVTPEHSYLDVLNDVSALAGSDIWLTQYTYDRGKPIMIHGTARSDDAVARLVEGLRRSRHLDRVELGSVTRPDTDKSKNPISVVQFTITGVLHGDLPLQPRRSHAARPVTPKQEPS